MFKNTASQKLTVFAFADAGHATLDAGEPVTGDAAQITCKVEQDDDGTQTASDDTNPTEVEDGQYRFDLTQAETNGNKLTFYPQSSTAGVQVVAWPCNVIDTKPPYFADLGLASDGDLAKVNALDGHTVQTGDSYARIGTPTNSLSDDMEAFFQLTMRSDAAIATDRAAYITRINADEGSGVGDWASTNGALENLYTYINSIETKVLAINTTLSESGEIYNYVTAIYADTNELQTDWKDGGRLDLLLDAIPTTAMRGTDGANTTKTGFALSANGLDSVTLPADLITAASIATGAFTADAYAANALVAATFAAASLNGKGDWNTVEPDPAGTAATEAQVIAAIAAYDGPTYTEMVAAFTEIKGATWAATDTLEGIRDRGDSAWVTATSVTVSDKTGFSLIADQSGVTIGTVNTLAGHTAQTADHTAAIAAIPTTPMRGTDNAATEAKQDIIDALLDRVAVVCIGNVTDAGTGTEVFVYGGVTGTVTVDGSGNRTLAWS